MYIILLVFLLIFFFWRIFWFYRDPERIIPQGENIVSPADGYIVYINVISQAEIFEKVFKKNKNIRFEGVPKLNYKEFYHIGIFMNLFDVHVNRSPVSGKIIFSRYFPSRRNLPMTKLWIKLALNIKPYQKNINHIFENERNVMLIDGKIPLYLIQIADIYVNKINNYISIGDGINKGERIGIIKMGSQVDIIFPKIEGMKIKVKERDKVFAGESIIVEI